jgi:hypothetical protein
MRYNNIYDFIQGSKVDFRKPIEIAEGWSWSMVEHLRKSFLYKNSQFLDNNENRTLRPNKNIILAIRNVENRTEGFDVKDIEIYINDPDEHYKSFLVRKFHEDWALENSIDTFIDELVDSYGDYGGVLVRNTNSAKPEVIDLRSLSFCNQNNILAYPFGIEHKLSLSELREYGDNNGWGDASKGATIDIEGLIQLCKDEKGIVVTEVHGTLPQEWLRTEQMSAESKKDVPQINIVAFYKKQSGDAQGVTLFRTKEPELPFKFLARDKIVDRALGRGGIEELFEPQKWTNWNEIKVTELLEATSKVIHLTDDPSVRSKHPTGLKNVTNNEFIEVTEGKKGIWQMDTQARSLNLFNDSLERWNNQANILASTQNLTEPPSTANMPFKLYEAQNIEDKSMHKFRQGQIATFMDEIYRDWIIPHLGTEIVKDQKFLSTLSADEMTKVADSFITNEANKMKKKLILSGMEVGEEEVKAFEQQVRDSFMKDNRKFLVILKGEMKKENLKVKTNIAGKQKNLALLTDKLVNIVRQYLATPQIRQDPGMSKLMNDILESSGMSPIMFSPAPMAQQTATNQPNPQPNATNTQGQAF